MTAPYENKDELIAETRRALNDRLAYARTPRQARRITNLLRRLDNLESIPPEPQPIELTVPCPTCAAQTRWEALLCEQCGAQIPLPYVIIRTGGWRFDLTALTVLLTVFALCLVAATRVEPMSLKLVAAAAAVVSLVFASPPLVITLRVLWWLYRQHQSRRRG